jgi:hypothetical protein
VVFVLTASANTAGYRYGVSDQAFYIPSVLRAATPAAFPHDAALIDAQGRLMVLDRLIAALLRWTGAPLDWIFFAGYLLSLILIWIAIVLIGRRVYTSAWATAALAAAVTLRHHIPRTSTNTLEGYFHPRMLAFGLGLLAIAAVLHRRSWAAVLFVAFAAIVHVTTAVWFAVLVGVALAVLDPLMRRLGSLAALAVTAVGAWALTNGPLRASMVRMDDEWLQTLSSRSELFPLEWPVWAWIANLGLLALLIVAYRRRKALHQASNEDAALVWGAAALVALFLATLPAVAARNAFAVQLQISRVFWMIDVLAVIYVIAVLPVAQRIIAVVLIAVAAARGIYIAGVEHPERGLFAIHLEGSPWNDAMRWLGQQPNGINVLADPGHAWKYGTSVRVSAGRDVFLEEVKDVSIGIYSREVAMRVLERIRVLGDFGTMTAERARELAGRYALDYAVSERPLDLPIAYRNARFTVYRLRADGNLR